MSLGGGQVRVARAPILHVISPLYDAWSRSGLLATGDASFSVSVHVVRHGLEKA